MHVIQCYGWGCISVNSLNVEFFTILIFQNLSNVQKIVRRIDNFRSKWIWGFWIAKANRQVHLISW